MRRTDGKCVTPGFGLALLDDGPRVSPHNCWGSRLRQSGAFGRFGVGSLIDGGRFIEGKRWAVGIKRTWGGEALGRLRGSVVRSEPGHQQQGRMVDMDLERGKCLQAAIDAIAVHGQQASQHVVDAMQAAIRSGDDVKASELERILRLFEDRLGRLR